MLLYICFLLKEDIFLKHFCNTHLLQKKNKKTVMSKFKELKDLVDGLEQDFSKFYNDNNNAAGTRVRKGMQELKTLAQEIRLEVQDIKNKAK